MSKQVVNLDFLDKEANIYKQSKQELMIRSENIRNTILENTKREVEEIQNAINNLNKKIDAIMKLDAIVDEKNKIDNCHNRMSLSIEHAANAFFKIREIIYNKQNLNIRQKKEYERKVYHKIISKFLNQEEIRMFEQLIKQNCVLTIPQTKIEAINM